MSKFPFALSIATLLISGCVSYRDANNTVSGAELPDMQFRQMVSRDTSINNHLPVALWWQELEDEQLGDLIQQALTANHDIRIALAAINESRALLRYNRLDYLPSLTTEISGTREQSSRDISPASGISERYSAGMNLSWEVDVFGRIHNQVQLSQAQLRANEVDFHGVQISLAAEVASTYLNVQALKAQMDVAQRGVDIQQQNLRLVEGFTEVGRSSEFDLTRARAQYEISAAHLPALRQNYRFGLNRLSVLTVLSVEELSKRIKFDGKLPSVPPSVAIGQAGDLLKSRPDILRAEQALKGAIAEYNLHVADFYPQISLTGNFGYLSTEWSRLGEEPSETFRFTPAIRWAALDLTRVKSQIATADARAQARLAEFEKTVLIALTETDNAITSFTQEELRRQRLHQAASASGRAANIARQTYEKGRGDLRDVLDAEQVRLNTAQQLIQSEEAILQRLVDIYKNLGGGWPVVKNG
ncbi:efflux transporter outer membrane subunit [Teredinibacter haidensis]|uniref:efflux transporter outer membrane subunit n=1 Tax=Teredinibacter haidensis TaxID=2731755 RepID=UPI000948FEA0|nr:TolC family protein [Teredinibacter haidensis]